MWKAIGQSTTGTSHTAAGKGCEDAIQYRILTDADGNETLICCISDGAGSTKYGGFASAYTTQKALDTLAFSFGNKEEVTEAEIYAMVEDIYDGLLIEAEAQNEELNEYSCTMLGCYITGDRAVFFQIGDGAIIRDDGSGFYTTLWWPHNGEYQNTTSFLIDDNTFSHLHITILEENVQEIAMFTDGLQMLALSMESNTVHQPFFTDLFTVLRKADDEHKLSVLNRKLAEYLDSKQINDRTDDDKTLFLATRS